MPIDNRAQRILDHNGNSGHGLGTIANTSQVPLSVSHPYNLSLLLAAGSTFFSWSGVTL